MSGAKRDQGAKSTVGKHQVCYIRKHGKQCLLAFGSVQVGNLWVSVSLSIIGILALLLQDALEIQTLKKTE